MTRDDIHGRILIEAIMARRAPMNQCLDPKDRSMTFSLDTPSIQTLKSEAKALRDERDRAGTPLDPRRRRSRRSPAGTAIATGTRPAPRCPSASPCRCRSASACTGTYLSRPFAGLVIGMQAAEPTCGTTR